LVVSKVVQEIQTALRDKKNLDSQMLKALNEVRSNNYSL